MATAEGAASGQAEVGPVQYLDQCDYLKATPRPQIGPSQPPGCADRMKGLLAFDGEGLPTSCGPRFRSLPDCLQGLLTLSPSEIG